MSRSPRIALIYGNDHSWSFVLQPPDNNHRRPQNENADDLTTVDFAKFQLYAAGIEDELLVSPLYGRLALADTFKVTSRNHNNLPSATCSNLVDWRCSEELIHEVHR